MTAARDGGPGQGPAGQQRHAHPMAGDADRRWLSITLGLIVAFMAAEVAAGLLAHSLALLSDAAHMLTDAGAIILALVTMRLAARPAKGGYTYGLKRAEILSAQANGLTLLLLSAWLTYEATRRLITPPHVAGAVVLITAITGVAVNLAATWSTGKASRASLNIKGAYQHILTDLYGFIATAIAGTIVLGTGFARADALASLVVVALMIRAGTGLVRESGRIFLEAAPVGLSPDAIGDQLAATPGVTEVHDLHIWQITSGQTALSAHVLAGPGTDCHAVRRALEQLLGHDYAITHTTLQVDHAPGQMTVTGTRAEPETHCEDPHGPTHTSQPHPH
ncbi:MAG TPA: cation diffusion facilitator family transporter [Streptosporangiaceae bacterium]|nr:cation diffusion facilitator family transporter [Streptosporangiaceae bacterium]